jgi:hypothetical protein
VTKYEETFSKVRERFEHNSKVVEAILQKSLDYYDISQEELMQFISDNEGNGKMDNQRRLDDALYHFQRDWSVDGEHERTCFKFILKAIEEHFPEKSSSVKIIVPGSGLGRLAQEIANLGYEVDACEWSPQMRTLYRYLESLPPGKKSESFYPYIDWWSHQPNTDELLHKLQIPDMVINSSAVALHEGDFNKIFTEISNYYDSLVTFFFIDTAKNVMDYFETMARIMKPGAIWVNVGPLLYYEAYLELSLEQIFDVAAEFGFEFLDVSDSWGPLTLPDKKARSREISYMFNPRSLRRNTYIGQFWVARLKKADE